VQRERVCAYGWAGIRPNHGGWEAQVRIAGRRVARYAANRHQAAAIRDCMLAIFFAGNPDEFTPNNVDGHPDADIGAAWCDANTVLMRRGLIGDDGKAVTL